jgi:hydroxymethylbilane synthase
MEKYPELNEEGMIEICVMKTQGDMVLDKSLMELGGKGLFTKELDTALLGNEVDICVHSMKDVPTWLPEKTVLPCTLERESTNDAFISSSSGTTYGKESYMEMCQLPWKRSNSSS